MRRLIVGGYEFRSFSVSAGPTPAEQFAGNEFIKYMTKLGIAEAGGLTVFIRIDETLPAEGFRVHIRDARDHDEMEICGGGPRGVIYGVYRFFEKYAGVRYFMPGLETYGEGNILVNEDYSYTPVFEYRRSDWLCGKDTEWSLKNGINCWDFLPKELGGSLSYAGFVHTFAAITGADQFTEQPCLSDPENLVKAKAWVRKMIAEHPDATIISVSQNDNFNHCTCEKCAAVDKEEGSPAGSLLRFVNAVAADIAEEFPHVVIDTLAYNYSQKAPAITKPLPNVCIRLCPIFGCFSHAVDDTTCCKNADFYSDLKTWREVCDRLYVWDYVINFCNYVATFPNFDVMRENMRIYADHNCKGMYPEGNYQSEKTGEFGELRCYLLAKLMWDPYMSARDYYDLMDEFLEAYYGAGWRYIRAYIDWAENAGKQNHMTIGRTPFEIITKDKWEAMEDTIENWWNKAEKMAGDRIEYVKRSRLQWEYVRLILHPNEKDGKKMVEAVEKDDIRWAESGRKADPTKLGLAPTKWTRG